MSSDPPPNRVRLSTHSSEFSWIDRVADREQQADLGRSGSIGIGDDAAFVPTHASGVLIATDTLLEGVHFDQTATPEQIGHKAIAVNLSDIAAMAGSPVAATVAISIPRQMDVQDVDRLMAGLQATAHRFNVSVVGGDTTVWDGPLAVTVTVLGEPGPQGPITRSGAQPGDILYVTGPLGGSLAGHHLRFEPRIEFGQQLARSCALTAMIDISDGLASDARHLAAASGCGITLDAAKIPIRDGLLGESRLQHALSDGEDFELLCALRNPGQTPPWLVEVGRCTEGGDIVLVLDGRTQPLEFIGFSHSLKHEE